MFRKRETRPSPASAVDAKGVELTDDDLEFVVGGLQRNWSPEPTVDPGATLPVAPEEAPSRHLLA